jgi:hypothetical protein
MSSKPRARKAQSAPAGESPTKKTKHDHKDKVGEPCDDVARSPDPDDLFDDDEGVDAKLKSPPKKAVVAPDVEQQYAVLAVDNAQERKEQEARVAHVQAQLKKRAEDVERKKAEDEKEAKKKEDKKKLNALSKKIEKLPLRIRDVMTDAFFHEVIHLWEPKHFSEVPTDTSTPFLDRLLARNDMKTVGVTKELAVEHMHLCHQRLYDLMMLSSRVGERIQFNKYRRDCKALKAKEAEEGKEAKKES